MKFFLLFVILSSFQVFSQVGINTAAPNSSSILDISASDKGVLVPRIALTGTNDVTTIASPANSLLIYNTSTTIGVNAIVPGFYFWNTATTTWTTIAGKKGWEISGNSGTTPANNFIGTTDNQDLSIKTNNTEKIRITAIGKVGIGTSTPDASAALDVNSTTGGFLMPRMTTAQRDAIANPSEGLQILNTTTTRFQGFVATGVPLDDISQMVFNNGISSSYRAGQSFRVNTTGRINSISFNSYSSISRTYSFEIRTGQGEGGAIVFSTSVFVPGVSYLSNTWINVPITNSLFVSANDYYTFVTTCPSSVNFDVVDVYPQGAAYQSGNISPNMDLAFKVNITPLKWIDLNWDKPLLETIATNSWSVNGNTSVNATSNFIGTIDPIDVVFKTAGTERTRITSTGNIGIGTPTPDGSLDIESITNTALYVKAPNSQIRLFENDNTNKQWKFEVNNGDFSITENAVATPFSILENSANNTLVLDNNVAKASKVAIGGGTTINKTQHGNLVVGAGTVGSLQKTVTLTFPAAFSSVPNVVATAINDGTFTDKFNVTVTNLTATAVTFIILRLDSPPPTGSNAGWGQTLRINWWAFE